MIYNEQAFFGCPDYYMSSLLSVPEDPMRDMEYQCSSTDSTLAFNDFSEAQMKAMYCGTVSTQTDTPTGVYSNIVDEGLQAPFDYPEVKSEYVNPIELAAFPFYCPYESTGGRKHDTSALNYLMPKDEVVSTAPYMDMDCQHAESNAFPLHMVKMEEVHESCSYLKDEAYTSTVGAGRFCRKNQRRSRASETEHNRRIIIAEKIQALQELLPAPLKVKRGNHEVIVDDVIAHVKYLQFQLKELSKTRLGGESLSALSFLEGYGHYHPREQMIMEPLEEVIGSLMKENQATALQTLESKGLHMMPMKHIDVLHSAE